MTAPRASLSQSLAQKTALSQQLRQSVELLQLSGPELQKEIETQLSTNPLLKLEDDSDTSFDEDSQQAPESGRTHSPAALHSADAGVAQDFREPNYLTWRGTVAEIEDYDPYSSIRSEESLSDHLLRQLGCLHLSPQERLRCAWIIGNLDEQGFLPDSLEEIAEDCAASTGDDGDALAWRTALRLVQSFDPVGVAAAGPTQALILQIDRSSASKPIRTVARTLLTHCPSFLAKRDYKTAAKTLGTDTTTVREAHSLILSLNPHPASAFGDTQRSGCVIAEVILVKSANGWKALLNPAVVAKLHFDERTYKLLTDAKLEGRDLTDWRTRAREAKNFVRALEMRYSTITAVAQTIADLQEAFFSQGPRSLRPLGLKDIAQRLNLSESTVSRAVSGKYLQSPAGTFELKHFFTTALTGEDGEAASAAAARRLIVEAIAQENPAKPLSDAAIAEILAEQGIHLARRTVAKYRELEQIPPKSLRKRLP